MKHYLKRSFALILSIMLLLGSISLNSLAAEISPMFLPLAPVITFDTDGVDPGEIVNVTITFKDISSRKVPFTIAVTNDAELVVNNNSDVQFETNGITKNMDTVTVNSSKSEMTVLTDTVAGGKTSSITFPVLAPLMSANFKVILTTDAITPSIKTVEEEIEIISGLTINAPDVLNDVDLFDVFGNAMYKKQTPPVNSVVFMQITNLDPTKPAFQEIQLFSDIVNDKYEFNDVKLSSDYEDGDYLIQVVLVNQDTGDILGYAEKQVKFIKKPDVLQKMIKSQGQQRYVSINDPLDDEGVFYPHLLVYPARGYIVPMPGDHHGDHSIQSKVTLKSQAEVNGAKGAEFIVHTYLNGQLILSRYPATKIANAFEGDLKPLATEPLIIEDKGVVRRPYVELAYTRADGVEVLIYVGELECILDPGGIVVDEDGNPVSDAIVTLYRFDEEDEVWVIWDDPTGNQINPQTTDEDGSFAWDVEDGQYDVRVYHGDYHNPGEDYSTRLDPDVGIINVPPEKKDILIILKNKKAEEVETEDSIEETYRNIFETEYLD